MSYCYESEKHLPLHLCISRRGIMGKWFFSQSDSGRIWGALAAFWSVILSVTWAEVKACFAILHSDKLCLNLADTKYFAADCVFLWESAWDWFTVSTCVCLLLGVGERLRTGKHEVLESAASPGPTLIRSLSLCRETLCLELGLVLRG